MRKNFQTEQKAKNDTKRKIYDNLLYLKYYTR